MKTTPLWYNRSNKRIRRASERRLVNFMNVISLQNVIYRYKQLDENGRQRELPPAVDDVSFDVEEGEFIALVGHNGSGKSTLAKLFNGLLRPKSGKVFVLGQDTTDDALLFEIRKNVGVVFQNPDNQMVATMVEDDVVFGPENIGLPPEEIGKRLEFALKAVGMEAYRNTAGHRLSGGQKQRIAIAGVLAVMPKILVLDESTAMLDPQGRREVMTVIKKLNAELKMTVILITHFMEEAAQADRILVMNDGKLVLTGTPGEIFARREELDRIGLDVPLPTAVGALLRERGLDLPGEILNEDELVEALCRLKSEI